MNNLETCIVVVFFNPQHDQIYKFNALSNYYPVIAVDNSSTALSNVNFMYYPLYENKGIAYAQNVGIKEALNHNYKYIVFFDQDSNTSENFVASMIDEYISIKREDDKLGILGPIVYDNKSDKEYKSYAHEGCTHTIVPFVISSGMIIDTFIIKSIGLMDERLFIDYVDCEWCWRAGSYGYHTYMTRNVKLYHSVGDSYFSFWGIKFGISKAFRYFYQYRNVIFLLRRNYVPFGWKIRSIIRCMLDMLVVPIISKEGFLCFKNMIRGIYSGVRYE